MTCPTHGLRPALGCSPWSPPGSKPAAAPRCRAIFIVGIASIALGCLGGFVFQWLERDAELARYGLNRAIYSSLVDSVDFEYCHDIAFKDVGYCRQHSELEVRLRGFFERAGNSVHDMELWTWLGSFFFVFHLSSTVGYATQGAPATPGGQLAAVIFGVVGIPLYGCALLIASSPLADGVAAALRLRVSEARASKAWFGVVACGLFGVLWFGAAVLFMLLEGWSYPRAAFFCFMTITTVGIGSDVPMSFAGRVVCVAYVYVSLGASFGILRAASRQNFFDAGPLTAVLRGQDVRSREVRVLACTCAAAVVVVCLLAGAVFPTLERAAELERYERSRALFQDLSALAEFTGCDKDVVGKMEFCRNAKWFRERLGEFFGPGTVNSMVDLGHWNFLGSAAFTLSLASTIGYGSQSPHTREGKVASVLFGAVAIPAFGCCALLSASALRTVATRCAQELAAAGRRRMDVSGHAANFTAGPLCELSLLLVGLWVAGAALFCFLEGWGPAEALYFCFVTLSAVGFANVTPQSPLGRIAMVAFIAVGLTSAASFASEAVSRAVKALGVEDADDDDDDGSRDNLAAPAGGYGTAAPRDVQAGCGQR